MYELVKCCMSFNCFLPLSFECKKCTFVRKEWIGRSELTLEKLKRDRVEPSSAGVQGVHRKNFVLSLERNKVAENSIELYQASIEWVQACT
jgi:hypothetical protein